jgi:hypothetical protein
MSTFKSMSRPLVAAVAFATLLVAPTIASATDWGAVAAGIRQEQARRTGATEWVPKVGAVSAGAVGAANAGQAAANSTAWLDALHRNSYHPKNCLFC